MNLHRMHFNLLILCFLAFTQCSVLFYRPASIETVKMDYKKIVDVHYNSSNLNPFPLTVKSGINTYASTDREARYLFFAGNAKGNFNIYLRDLNNSLTFPITLHPSEETKPAISPDGTKLVFVSERFDTNGDLLLLEVDPEYLQEKYLRGERVTSQDKTINLTSKDNPRAVDTDPVWSSDGRFILFVTDRFTPGITNAAILDTENQNKIIPLTKNGAASPTFSPDGTSIYYLSYKDNKQGEIYKYELDSKRETRVTTDSYKDLSPSVSEDGKFLIYSSIRRDTNGNGRLDSGDHASIIRVDLSSGKEIELSTGTYSLFDTKYSNLNGGSILFTAGINNALNIYFMPIDGSIPKKENPRDQYKLSINYENTHSYYYRNAVEAIQNFHSEHPLTPYYLAKAELNLLKEYLKEGRKDEYNQLKSFMLGKKTDTKYALSYVYAYTYDEFRRNGNPIPEITAYYELMKKNSNVDKNLLGAIQFRIAQSHYKVKNYRQAESTYREIFKSYPNFYDSIELKKNIGRIEFLRSNYNIPDYYIEILGSDEATRYDNKTIIEDIIKRYKEIRVRSQRIETINSILTNQPKIQTNKELWGLLKYLQAESHYKNNQFELSLDILEEVTKKVKPKSYVYLQSHLLKSSIHQAEEKVQKSQRELEYFIKNYDYQSGIDLEYTRIEDSLVFYESRARMFQIEGNPKKAIVTYNENDEILSLAKESRIPISEIYNKYGTYFQKKYVDAVIDFSFKKNLKEEDFLMSQLNAGKQLDTITTTNLARIYGIPVIGEITKPFGDFRDLQFTDWFTKDNSHSAVDDYKSKLDKARENLDSGTIYGYAYLITSRAVYQERKLLDSQSMTLAKKKQILRELKQAEYDLRWIIHSDPTFIDAYMLLGWIYQYVDISKQRITFPSEEREIEEYESAYKATFPLNYLEENIDLFNQLSEFLGKSISEKTQFDININLANNYFLLNNYQKALSNFKKADQLSDHVIHRAAFEDYRKEALYRFNYGRTEIYNGNNDQAIDHFNYAIDIYYQNEYFPAVSQAGIDPDYESLVQLSEAKRKIALLSAIKGSSELSLKKYEDAIQSFTLALSMNGFSEYIDDISLYNALAICHQNLGEINESEKNLRLAFKEYEKRKSGFSFPSFSIWNLILPEKDRVIGDGKIPGEMSAEFNHLLSRGIQIKNQSIEKEYQYTEDLIQERNNWVRKNGLNKTVLGNIILENSLNEIAYNQFQRGNYKKANELYIQDMEIALEKGNDALAFQFLKRASLSLFSLIEENREDVDYLVSTLHTELDKLESIKSVELKNCSRTNPNISECEKEFHKNFKQFEVIQGYNYFYLGELYSHLNLPERSYYYFGIALSKLENPNQINPEIIGLASDIFNKKERSRLKIAVPIIHLKLGNRKKFSEEMKEAYYFANQFYQERELIHILILEAENYYKYANSKTDYLRSLEKLNQAGRILEKNPGLFLQINESTLGYLFKLKNYNNFKLNNYAELHKDREALFSSIFFKQLLTNQLHLREKTSTDLLNQMKNLVRKDLSYIKKLENSLTLGLNTALVEKGKKENYDQIIQKASEFQKSTQLNINILGWMNPPNTKIEYLNSRELAMEIYLSDQEFMILASNGRETSIQRSKLEISQDIETSLRSLVEKTIDRFPGTESLVIIPPPSLHSMDLVNLPYRNSNLNESFSLRFLPRRGLLSMTPRKSLGLRRIATIDTRIRDKRNEDDFFTNSLEYIISPFKVEKKYTGDLNYRIINSIQIRDYSDDTNVFEGPTDFSNRKLYLGESRFGYLNLKDIIEEQTDVQAIVLNNYIPNRDNYMKVSFLLDIFQMSNTDSILLIPSSSQTEEIRNRLLENLKEGKDITQQQKVIVLGRSLPRTDASIASERLQEIEKLNDQGIKYERIGNYTDALRQYMRANSLIDPNDIERQVQQEINIARVKSNTRKKNKMDPFLFLLDKFEKSGKNKKNILFQATTHCYIIANHTECEKFYSSFLKEDSAEKTEKESVEFYKNLAQGNKFFVYENYNSFSNLPKYKDSFLYELQLSKLFLKQFMWRYAFGKSRQAGSLAKTQKELEMVRSLSNRIQWEKYFITGKRSSEISQISDKAYSQAVNRNWIELKSRIAKEIPDNTSNYYRKNYLSRLYESYKKLYSESDFEPLNLGPLYLKDGSSSQMLLEEDERSFLFFTLTQALEYQKGDELNNNFDILHKSELSVGNTNRANWMLIEWAANLYYIGDKKSAKRYYQLFEKNYKYSREEIVGVYSNLKYKLSLHFEDIKINAEDLERFRSTNPDWQKQYIQLSELKNTKDFIPFMKEIFSKQNIELDEYSKRQIFDLLEISMKRALDKNDKVSFLELGFLKDRAKVFNQKTLGRNPLTKDIVLPESAYLVKLLNKLPPNQSIKGIMDMGIESFRFTLENNQIDIKKVLADHRNTKFDTYRYLFMVKDEGGSIAQQKVLEKRYRNILEFKQLQFTYLYLPGFHFKVPIKPRRLDRFVYFLNPTQLLNNPIHNMNYDFQMNFPIKQYNSTKKNYIPWQKKIALERMEINYLQGTDSVNPFIVSSEDLLLQNGRQLQFGGRPLTDTPKMNKRIGSWMHTGSMLVSTSLKTDDLVHSLYFLDQLHLGPGVVNATDSQDTHTAFFLRNFLTKENQDMDFHERYFYGYESLRRKWKEDKYWNGWKPYTNTLLLEKKK